MAKIFLGRKKFPFWGDFLGEFTLLFLKKAEKSDDRSLETIGINVAK
jgi:hypothetical protein